MPAHKGHAKAGGRKKGVPNKDKQELVARLNAAYPKWDPVMAMADIANQAKNPIDLRFAACKEVAQYIHPKRKAIEHSGEIGQRLTVTDDIPSK